MPILARLVSLYEKRGIEISTGLNPSHFSDYPLAPFTWFIREGKSLTNGLGISLQEIYFLECLFARFHPQRPFVIGNSAGWSTLALALANPAATVLAIDAGFDTRSLEGIELTNSIAQDEGLKVRVVKAVSPMDVDEIVRRYGAGPIDFAFVDGLHTVEQIEKDFDAIRANASADCAYLFHDVQTCNLHEGIERIAAKSGLVRHLLLGTSSGMVIMHGGEMRPAWLSDIAPFEARAGALDLIRDAAWGYRHPNLARWRRSLRKRVARLRR
jgi:hypothetical protein